MDGLSCTCQRFQIVPCVSDDVSSMIRDDDSDGAVTDLTLVQSPCFGNWSRPVAVSCVVVFRCDGRICRLDSDSRATLEGDLMSLKSSHRITGRTGVRNARGSSSGSSQRTRTDGQGVGGGGCTDGSHTTGADRRGVMSFLVPGGSLGAVGDGAFAHDCGGWSVFVRTAGPCIGIWRPLGLACTPDVVPEATCRYYYLPPGAEFQDLFKDRDFLTHIRAINNQFAMASTVCTDDTYTVRDANGCVRKCPFASMRVTGQIRAMISTNISSIHGPAHSSGKRGFAEM